MHEVWFWQRIISPHTAFLAMAMARRGIKVKFIAERVMSADRVAQGWVAPELEGVDSYLVENEKDVKNLLRKSLNTTVHICQGIRGNGNVGVAQREIANSGGRQWVLMETVQDFGWKGFLRRLEYRRIFKAHVSHVEGVLAIGHRTKDWVVARGVDREISFPFAYFLKSRVVSEAVSRGVDVGRPRVVRLLYAGQLSKRKRVDWILTALHRINPCDFEFWIVGGGAEEADLRQQIPESMKSKIFWLGQLPLPEVPAVMNRVDCLILASDHDGWGAVASEALIEGTPVICSDACGVAEVVKESGAGGVFEACSLDQLTDMLRAQISRGLYSSEERKRLADWAQRLTADSGAEYLEKILRFGERSGEDRPKAPWAVGYE